MSDVLTGSAPAEAPATVETLAGLFEADLKAENAPPPRREQEAPADDEPAEIEAQDDGAEPAAVDDGLEESAVEAEAEAEADPTDGQADEPSPTTGTIDAPPGMTEADKAAYAKLTPELKTWVSKRMQEQTADYTRKTQDVATRRKAVDEVAGLLVGRMQQYDALLARFVNPDIRPPNPALRVEDPDAYEQALAEYVQRKDLSERAGAERMRLVQEAEAAAAERNRIYWAEEAKTLSELAPDLAESTPKAAETRKKIHAYAVNQGFAPERLAMVSAQEMVLLRKAMLYDSQQAATKAVRPVTKPPAKVVKPGSATPQGRPSDYVRAVQNLRQSPTVDSLAAAFEAELRAEKR
jgi:hypothetical protein